MSTNREMQPGLSAKGFAIVTGASLTWNPRAAKEATTLARAGFDVVVYGSSADQSSFENDQTLARRHGFAFKSVVPVSRTGTVEHHKPWWPRLRGRLGRDAYRFLGLNNHWQLGNCGPELLREAGSTRSDYYIVHLEQAMWVGESLMRTGRHVGVDMEDWYSEDLLLEARKHRPIRLLHELEGELLRRGAHTTCPSQAMSEALAREYGCPPPTVIYNAFPWSDRKGLDGMLKDRRNRRVPSVHWYSQTLGAGRGLEDLLAALPQVTHEAEIHLRGNPAVGFVKWLSCRVPENWSDRVYVHPLVPNDELLSRISEHDIGFAGEMKYCRSRDLTVTNKILHYLLAGLAVVASDTSGQQEVAQRAPDAVFLYPSGDAAALAMQLNALLESRDRLQRAKAAALRAAEDTFCWERQNDRLLDTIARAIEAPARRMWTR